MSTMESTRRIKESAEPEKLVRWREVWARGEMSAGRLLMMLQAWEDETARNEDELDAVWELRLLVRGESNHKTSSELEAMLNADCGLEDEVIEALRDLAGVDELSEEYAPVIRRLCEKPDYVGALREVREEYPLWAHGLSILLERSR